MDSILVLKHLNVWLWLNLQVNPNTFRHVNMHLVTKYNDFIVHVVFTKLL